MTDSNTQDTAQCASCGAQLYGKYCHQCGEKILRPAHDFSVRHFLETIFEHITHLDSKLIRTFWFALTRPGYLTAEFIAGRRMRYMKPISLFVTIGVLFYLFFPTASAFYANPEDLVNGYQTGNWLSNAFFYDTPALIDRKSKELNLETAVFIRKVNIDKAAPTAKAFLFLIIPFWGAVLWLFFRRKIPWLVPHLILALHGLAFFILFDLVFLGIMMYVFHFQQLGDRYILFVFIVMVIWCTLAVKRVYDLRTLLALFTGPIVAMAFFILLNYYRQAITIWSLWHYSG